MIINFDVKQLEEKFTEAEDLLLDSNNVNILCYNDNNCETFDELNQEFLRGVSKKSIVYCLWTGKSENDLNPKYIGHVGGKYARQRMRNHLAKKT